MINSQEIIERSIYEAILQIALKLGVTLDPKAYYPVTPENSQQWKTDWNKLKTKVSIFGTGNNQVKGIKETPRIVVNAKGFYPGGIGLPKEIIEKLKDDEGNIKFISHEEPYDSLDQYIDVHLVANNQEDLRLLHQILFWSVPQRGYIKPYTAKEFLPTGNIFVELSNFFDRPGYESGILEKVYEFEVFDCLLGENPDQDTNLAPLIDASIFLNDSNEDNEPLIHVTDEKP